MSTVISEQIIETRTTMMHEDGFEWSLRKERMKDGRVIVCAYALMNGPLSQNDTFVHKGKIYRFVNEDLVCEGNDTSDEEMYLKLCLLCKDLNTQGARLMLFEPDDCCDCSSSQPEQTLIAFSKGNDTISLGCSEFFDVTTKLKAIDEHGYFTGEINKDMPVIKQINSFRREYVQELEALLRIHHGNFPEEVQDQTEGQEQVEFHAHPRTGADIIL